MEKPFALELVPKDHPFKLYCFGYIKQNFDKLSQREIARRLKIGKTTVNCWSKNLGLFFKKHSVNEDFFKKWSPKMAYIVGYIMADGNIAWNPSPKKSYRALTITAAKKDRNHLEKIRKILQSTKKLLYSSGTKSYRLIVHNKTICQDLMKIGVIPRKSLRNKFPMIPKKFLRHFIRGVIDGDGSVGFIDRERSPYFEIRVYFASENFCQDFVKHINNDIRVGTSPRKIGDNLWNARYTCQRGLNVAKWIYKDTNLFLKRKFRQYRLSLNYKRGVRKE